MNNQTLKVYDTEGEWFVSEAKFPCTDPETGARFEPGVPTQAKRSAWIGTQPALKDYKTAVEKPAKASK